ncbi:hypothetical protein V5799_018680 [Amblyomma americanum]|uniref:Uncharacterized protein n=1 Tax=Amblyomma americanum TaxID=6943 RepID=A0AAQ4EYW0_AMBAM
MIIQLAALLATAALVSAGGHGGYGHHGGASKTYRKQNDHGHYSFGYDIVNGYGAVNGRHETGSAYGPVHGSYYLGDIDGRHRRVHYVADKLGFRAAVKTNEPGTKSSLPAAAPYHSAHGKAVPAYGHGGYGGYEATVDMVVTVVTADTADTADTVDLVATKVMASTARLPPCYIPPLCLPLVVPSALRVPTSYSFQRFPNFFASAQEKKKNSFRSKNKQRSLTELNNAKSRLNFV